MEEKRMFELGFVEMNSSELQCRGGITWDEVIKDIKSVVDFIVTYLPKLIGGFASGWSTVK